MPFVVVVKVVLYWLLSLCATVYFTVSFLAKLYPTHTPDMIVAELEIYLDRKTDKWESIMVKKETLK